MASPGASAHHQVHAGTGQDLIPLGGYYNLCSVLATDRLISGNRAQEALVGSGCKPLDSLMSSIQIYWISFRKCFSCSLAHLIESSQIHYREHMFHIQEDDKGISHPAHVLDEVGTNVIAEVALEINSGRGRGYEQESRPLINSNRTSNAEEIRKHKQVMADALMTFLHAISIFTLTCTCVPAHMLA